MDEEGRPRPDHLFLGSHTIAEQEAARPHVACVKAIDAAGTEPHWFSDEVLRVSETSGGRLHWVEGVAEALIASYQTGETPRWPGSEAAGLWAGLQEGF